MSIKPSKSLFHDHNLCMGCHSCQIACKMEHDLPAGVNRFRIVTAGPSVVKGKMTLNYLHVRCQHCARPLCVKACPTKAINKRSDGIVYIDRAKCTGCKACADACKWGAIGFHPHQKWAEICDLCFDRLDEGLEPFCVKHCLSGALFYGTQEEFDRRREKIAAARGGAK